MASAEDAVVIKQDSVQPESKMEVVEIPVLQIPNHKETRMDRISRERVIVIQTLALESRKAKGVPDASRPKVKELNERLDMLLRWLDEELQITPEFKSRTKIDTGLKLIFDTPQYEFSSEHAEKAKALYEKWEAENWGKTAVEDEDDDEADESQSDSDAEPAVKRRRTSTTSTKENKPIDVARLLLPPPNHRIWGVDGIMHGLALKRSDKKKTQILDPRYKKKNFKVYGSNGLNVGTWFPFQLSALFRGVHGMANAGISGDTERGAYSIVVAKAYDVLDQDNGDILHYSGSGSHENTDPKNPPDQTSGTKALYASLLSGEPVRVLRASTGKSKWAPTAGLRYDGLYNVVEAKQPTNKNGGLYDQFKLQRRPGQEPLENLRGRPNPTEIRELKDSTNGY